MGQFRKYFPFILVLLALCIAECIIHPIGEFALNDDFAYARSVYIWDKTGVFQIGAWPAMSLFSHSLLGLIFAKLFGFSYVVLRFSNMALCVFTLFFIYKFFLVYRGSSVAGLVCALIVFNPYYMNIFNSFMTDLTFFNYSFLAFYFLHSYFISRNYLNLLPFFLFTILSILARQFGVLLLFAFVAVSLIEFIKSRQALQLLTSTALMLIGFLILFYFEKKVFNVQEGHNYQGLFVSGSHLKVDTSLGWNVFEKTVLFLKFCGSFFILFLVLYFPALKNRVLASSKIQVFIGMLLFIISLFIVNHKEITGHLVINFGLGIESTVDRLYIGTNISHGSNNFLFYGLMSLFIAGYLLFGLWFSSGRINGFFLLPPQKQFIILLTIGYFLLLGIAETAFDRYCLFAGIFLVIYLMMGELIVSKQSVFISVFLLVLIGSFSVLATKDYFTAARLKEKIRIELTTNYGVKDFELNPGAEHLFWDKSEKEFDWISWDHFNDKMYLTTRGPLQNFTVFKAYTYKRYLPPCIDTFYVLKKNTVR